MFLQRYADTRVKDAVDNNVIVDDEEGKHSAFFWLNGKSMTDMVDSIRKCGPGGIAILEANIEKAKGKYDWPRLQSGLKMAKTKTSGAVAEAVGATSYYLNRDDFRGAGRHLASLSTSSLKVVCERTSPALLQKLWDNLVAIGDGDVVHKIAGPIMTVLGMEGQSAGGAPPPILSQTTPETCWAASSAAYTKLVGGDKQHENDWVKAMLPKGWIYDTGHLQYGIKQAHITDVMAQVARGHAIEFVPHVDLKKAYERMLSIVSAGPALFIAKTYDGGGHVVVVYEVGVDRFGRKVPGWFSYMDPNGGSYETVFIPGRFGQYPNPWLIAH